MSKLHIGQGGGKQRPTEQPKPTSIPVKKPVK